MDCQHVSAAADRLAGGRLAVAGPHHHRTRRLFPHRLQVTRRNIVRTGLEETILLRLRCFWLDVWMNYLLIGMFLYEYEI